MYQISNECKKAINHYSRELYSKAYINNNEIYASDIISYEINEGIISGSDFELGGAVASTLEIKINNLHGAYNDIELNGKEIKIFTGILLEDNSIEYVPMGIFIIDEAVKDKNIIVIEATDKMVTLEDYYESKLTFPTTVLNIANEICTIAGITLATKQFYNSNYIVNSLPFGITLRDVIHDIAEIAGGFSKINRIGELEIITPGKSIATEINKDRYIDMQIKEGFYVDNLTIVENYFPVPPVPINLNVLPFSSKWQGDFSIDPGDKVILNDGKGTYETIITKQKITFNGGLRYESECTGLSDQQKSTQQISNTEKTNKRYRSEIKQLANEISQKVSSGDFEAYQKITDEKIENKVTKTEAEHIVNSKVEQTENKWSATFESSGAYNLIENSTGFNKVKNGWENEVGDSSKIYAWYRANEKVSTGYYMGIYRDNDTSTSIYSAISSRFNLAPNTTYTFTGKFNTHKKSKGVRVTIKTSNSIDYIQEDRVTFDNSIIIYEANENSWVNVKNTFTTGENVKSGFIQIEHLGYDVDNPLVSNSNTIFWADLLLVEGEVSKPWCPHANEIYSGSTIIDASGVTVNNGDIRVKNKAGTTVLEGDTEGNLILLGTMKSQKGDQYVALNSGGITFQDAHRNEQIVRMATSAYASNADMNGMIIGMAQYCDYIRFSHLQKADLSQGWDSSVTAYNFFDLWASKQIIGSTVYQKGINVFAPVYMKGKMCFQNSSDYTSDICNLNWNTIQDLLGICGDNGLFLGYRSAGEYKARIVLTEGAHPGTGDNIRSWGNWNLSEATIHNGHFNGKSLTISGSKNCLQKTNNYGERLINAYETAEYYFGDIGSGIINKDGECLVGIDDVFQECVNTDIEYHVFTQIYNGVIRTIERNKTYFIVKGEPGTSFSWELKAKRIGYENNRLDIQDLENNSESGVELFNDDDFKANTSEETLNFILDFNLEDLLLEVL